jgi:hypothetical protein
MRHGPLIALLAAGGCGEPPPGTATDCHVDLSGNLVESITSPASCPVLAPGAGASDGDTLLKFTVESRALDATLTIDVDLGAEPTPGTYSAETTALWSATAVKPVAPGRACVFIAGNNATPMGYFMLELASIDALRAHGELSLTLAVLPRTSDDGTQTDCGAGTTEEVAIRF